MIATFTPPGGLTLTKYANQLGYINFDWQQTITNWPNPDLQIFGDGTITAPTAFLDPPLAGYAYNPCGSNPSIGGGPAPGDAAGANPFYFNTTTAPSTSCWSLIYNETPTTNPTTLKFGDEPMDPHLTSSQIAANNIPKFTTALVGILKSGEVVIPSSPLFSWTWKTTYTGSSSSGGVATTANSPDFDPGVGGTGSVTVTSVNGVPCQNTNNQERCEGQGEKGASVRVVPEPPGSLLLASGMLAILAARRMARSKKAPPI
jgi:hypothetical protein